LHYYPQVKSDDQSIADDHEEKKKTIRSLELFDEQLKGT